MKHSISAKYIVRSLLALSLMSSSVYADTPIMLVAPNFTDGRHEQFKLAGDAVLHEDFIKLNRNVHWTSGEVMHRKQVLLPDDASFSAYFSFSIADPECTKGSKGGDGLAFVLKTNRDITGGHGLGIGYGGIPNSVAIEFDTFFNPEFVEPVENHIGVNFNGVLTSVVAEPAPFPLNSGERHHAWIDFDGTRNLLEVRVGNSESRPSKAALSRSVDIKAVIGTAAYVGFTAATGICREQHAIHAFYFHKDLVPGGIDVTADSYAQNDTSIENFQAAGN